jgi:hypothetical protein
MSAVQNVFESEEVRKLKEENEKLQAMLKANREKMKQNKGVTCQVTPTSKGTVGFKINGLGIPKFFYKQQAKKLLDDSAEAVELRKQILLWIESHDAELTDKE